MKKTILIVGLILTSSAAMSDVFSNLIVVKEAAQTGMWTNVSGGTMPDGTPMPKNTETFCATKEQILKKLNHAMYYDTKTGKEQKDCPTLLTTNTSTLGIAKMTCPAQSMKVSGKVFKIPGFTAIAEFKKINKNSWIIKFGNITSTMTYAGSATANCTPTKE